MPRQLDELRRQMQRVSEAERDVEEVGVHVRQGLAEHAADDERAVPQPMPGLVHEVVEQSPLTQQGGVEFVASAMFIHWASHATRPARFSGAGSPATHALWIARFVRPYPLILHRHPNLLERSLFIDAHEPDSRLWAIELALRSPAVAVVIADGRGLSMTATRRLQLATRESHALLLLARSPNEPNHRSAAAMRWAISPTPSPTKHPRWTLNLIRCKAAATPVTPRQWTLEWNHETSMLHIPADLADRSDQTPAQPRRRAG